MADAGTPPEGGALAICYDLDAAKSIVSHKQFEISRFR
jgi:hypothetical protein